MSKKSFRPQRTPKPNYPKLSELAPQPLLKWGLAALGGLLIGESACKKADECPLSGQTPTAIESRHLGGEPAPVRRAAPRDAGQDSDATSDKTAQPNVSRPIHLGVGGGLPPARVTKKPPPAKVLPDGDNPGGLDGLKISGTSSSARTRDKGSKQHR